MKSLLSIVFLAVTSVSQAQNTSPQLQEMVNKISQVRKALKLSASQSQACDTPQSPNCTFESSCSQFAGKSQDFYLYQDSEGRQIPNNTLVGMLSFSESCAEGPFPQAAVADPFVYVDQLLYAEKAGGKEKLKRNKERMQKEQVRAKKIFEDARQHVVKALEAKQTTENAAEISNMISRVKAVKFRAARTDGGFAELADDGCESINMYYIPDGNSILVCPQYLNFPDGALFATFAHEFGHAIDTCAMLVDYSKRGAMSPEWMDPTVTSEPVVSPAILAKKNPFKEVVTCLQSPNSIGVKVPTKQALLAEVDQYVAEMKGDAVDFNESGGAGTEEERFTDASEAQYEESRQNIHKHYDNFKGCGTFSGNQQLQEAFSDWVSSQAMASKLSTIPEAAKAREFAFTGQATFLSVDCDNIIQTNAAKTRAIVGKDCLGLQMFEQYVAASAHDDEEGSHPSPRQRVNKIYFAKPEIRKALGCQGPEGAQECK